MLRTEDEKIIERYKEVHKISSKEKSSVSLVINIEDNQIAVKKDIQGIKVDVYKKLKEVQLENIPQIYHIIKEDNSFTVFEEFIEGSTLQELLKSSDFATEDNLFDILEQLCCIMKLLHNLPNPIIHRDIKPSNIIISNNGVLKLIDFDASREFKLDNKKDTVCLGTIEYAAPEQYGFSQTDVRSDIYAIGMLISEFMKRYDEYNPNQRFHSVFQRVIDKCTMFDPKQRYQNIDKLVEGIKNVKKEMNQSKHVLFLSTILGTCIVGVIVFVCILLMNENRNSYGTSFTDNITEGASISLNPIITQAATDNTNDIFLVNEEMIASSADEVDVINTEIIGQDQDSNQNNHVIISSSDDSTKEQDSKDTEKASSSKETTNTEDSTKNSNTAVNKISPQADKAYDNNSEQAVNDNDTGASLPTEGSPSSAEATPVIEPTISAEPTPVIEPTISAEPTTAIAVNDFKQPVFYVAWNSFYKSNPQDIYIKIEWNDATKITNIISEWTNTPYLSSTDYIIDSNCITIKKEALEKLVLGEYRWCALFDTNFGNSITIDVFD